jgi:hypothetical protein
MSTQITKWKPDMMGREQEKMTQAKLEGMG